MRMEISSTHHRVKDAGHRRKRDAKYNEMEISKLFPALTLEDAPKKKKKEEEALEVKKLKDEEKLKQYRWKSFIGVMDVSAWTYVDKKPKSSGTRKPLGVDKRRGVDKRKGVDKKKRMRVWDNWFTALITYPGMDGIESKWLGVYRTPEEAALVYDRQAYRIFGSQTQLLNFPHLIATNTADPMIPVDEIRFIRTSYN